MSDPRAATPEEFGERLRNTREARGITLEFISTKTKISLLTLQALEAGAFNRLPAAVFSRMFLRQYLQLVGEEPGPWLETFDHLWRRWEASSHPFPVVAARETPVRPWARWLVGFLLVAVALTLVLWLERRERDSRPAAPPTPQALVQELAPTPPTQKVPEE
ncbi:MAG: helix-turn-helix domain-containing protein, partial [Thermoanaerobaculum sp.]|nr:helix-turn-helix domain-containing protein [Thermoanaerobaculum sp.]MDW7968328.1 helix-turn-helix domain-containing protein [Thermoanaerobaculum sp.]